MQRIVTVLDTALTVNYNDRPISTQKDLDTYKFEFDDSWQGYTKTAVFYTDPAMVKHLLIPEDGVVIIPWEILTGKPQVLYIGVFGTKDSIIKPTTFGAVRLREGSYIDGVAPLPPTPDVYQQIISAWEGAKTEEEVRVTNENSRRNNFDALVIEYNALKADLQQKITDGTASVDALQVLESQYAAKALALETTYAPRLGSVESQLAETVSLASAMAGGSPKGAYATLATLQIAYPTGTTGAYVVTADGHLYFWNGVWTDSGIVYQATGIADGTVSPTKTNFVLYGKNLFDKDTASKGYYVNQASGALVASASYDCSDYIAVIPEVAYAISLVNSSTRIVYYNANKGFLSGALNPGNIVTTPLNATYIRFSFSAVATPSQQFELGNVVTEYQSYGYQLAKQLPLDNGEIAYAKTDFVSIGKNLFDKLKITLGFYVNNTTGLLAANADHFSSDFIAVESEITHFLSGSGSTRIAFYDKNKVFMSGVSPLVNPFTTPVNAKYLRFSQSRVFIDTAQLEVGSAFTEYEKYGLKMIQEAKRVDDDFLLFLPSEICVAVGRTIELYNNQIAWSGDSEKYHFQWDCAIGKAMKRKFSVVGGAIGEYALTLNVYDRNMRLFKTASTIIKVVANTIIPASMVAIGDSLTNAKPWLAELRALSSNQLTLLGIKGTAPLQHEGRSGFSAASYLAGTIYTYESEGIHPFWDGTRFNWNYYKTNTGINPSAVQIFLGTNDMLLDPTVNAGNIKQIVDYIRQDDATIPILLVNTLFRGNQDGLGNQTSVDGYSANKGAWELQEDRKVFNLMVKLNELLSGYSNLHFVPISTCHDSEYNFGAVATPVNPRAVQTELLPVEGTHPQDQGYLQMADIMYSVLCKIF